LLDYVCADDAEIVVRNVCEGGPAFDVAECVDIFCRGFEFIVDVDEVVVVRGDPCSGKIERVRVWNAASSNEEMRALKAAHLAVGSNFEMDAGSVARDSLGASFKQKVNAVRFEDICHCGGDVGIFLSEQSHTRLNNGDSASQSAEELAELEADVAATENHQMFGNDFQLHNGSAGEKPDVLEASDLRNGGTAAGVDEETIGCKDLILS